MQRFAAILSCCTLMYCSTLTQDLSLAAIDGNDHSVVFVGPGSKSQKGYLFLQLEEGGPTKTPITIVVPKLICNRDSCVSIQFFRKDGQPGYASGIPKGQNQFKIPLSTILGHNLPISKEDEGEYPVLVQMFFLDEDGLETNQIGKGFIRLNILTQDFVPLGCNDPSVAWKTKIDKDCEAQFTVKFRSILCGGCTSKDKAEEK